MKKIVHFFSTISGSFRIRRRLGMGKSSKSKRFVQQGKNTVSQHAERIPYHSTYAEAEEKRTQLMSEQSYGGL